MTLQRRGLDHNIFTDGSTQAMEYNLKDSAVIGASNSGQTKELIRLFEKLKSKGRNTMIATGLLPIFLPAFELIANNTHVLNSGKEDAVAATKSVFEQALFYDALLHYLAGEKMTGLDELAVQVGQALTMNVDNEISDIISKASIIYFAGRNTGVAEELTLKTNEITRKKSMYLEGTYSLHGIEEIMDSSEVIIWISPFPEEIDEFNKRLVKGVGLNVIAISNQPTPFPTVIIPESKKYREYTELAAGWNLLVETGIMLGADLDKPVRARKIGNEFTD